MRWIVAIIGLAIPAWGLPLRPMSSAEVCGQCHRSILDAWKESAHARAMEGRLFQDALLTAENEAGPAARRTCLGCHAPIAVQSGDLQLDRKVSWEGVTCDYCHSMRDVTMEGGTPRPRLEFGLVKSGPLKQAISGVHTTAYSAVHESSRVCAPCHEFKNAQGFPVLSTFSEWQASRFAKEGRNCQSCHMYNVEGKVVDARVKRVPETRINLHRMPGSRSVQQLTQAVRARMAAVRDGGKVKVTVDVYNAAAGHYVPTGSPLRQLILDVQAAGAEGARVTGKRVYTRTIADAAGKPLAKEHTAFLKAAKTLSDTRLKPGETRKEEFEFELPPSAPVDVKATLSYYYSPTAQVESERRISFLNLQSRVK